MSSHEWIYIAIVIVALILIIMPSNSGCPDSMRFIDKLARDNAIKTEDLTEIEIEPGVRRTLSSIQPDRTGGMWHAEPSHLSTYKKMDIDDSSLELSLRGGSDPSVDSSYIRFSCH